MTFPVRHPSVVTGKSTEVYDNLIAKAQWLVRFMRTGTQIYSSTSNNERIVDNAVRIKNLKQSLVEQVDQARPASQAYAARSKMLPVAIQLTK